MKGELNHSYSVLLVCCNAVFNEKGYQKFNFFAKTCSSQFETNRRSTILIGLMQCIFLIICMQQKQEVQLTSKAWLIMDQLKQCYLRGHNIKNKMQIASITKAYTLYACLMLNKLLNIDPQKIIVSTFETKVSGTSANLQIKRHISLLDLYYALMLPSGNDAACILACYYGAWIVENRPFLTIAWDKFKKESLGEKLRNHKIYVSKFVHFMNHNLVKSQLQHLSTHFENPHGLADKYQYSTAWEVGSAIIYFLKNPLFKKVCNTISYSGTYFEDEETFQWENTNILLKQQYNGVKTGFTESAGGCLASLKTIQTSKYDGIHLLVIVLGATDRDKRFTETKELIEDYQRYIKLMKI